MENKIKTILDHKGFRLGSEKKSKLIKKFDMTEAANNLFLFLSTHQSCRILFNSLIKAKNPLIDPEEIIYDFKERLKVSSCSFIYCANCKCGVPLDKPTIIDNNFKLPKQKDITCNKCGILNKINPNDYFPVYDFFVNDVVKLFIRHRLRILALVRLSFDFSF